MLKLIRSLLFILPNLINKINLHLSGIKSEKLKIDGLITISNLGLITIGKRTRINSSPIKNVIGGDTRTSLVVKKGAKLSIGENVKISNSAIYCADKITIGNNVMIGGSTKIWDSDFHPLDPVKRLETPNEGYVTRPILIHDNVFVGGSSIILKGTEIGENSVIGAGSVVSGKIPPNEIWAGNPAVYLKELIH